MDVEKTILSVRRYIEWEENLEAEVEAFRE
jgi:hypothetical protein